MIECSDCVVQHQVICLDFGFFSLLFLWPSFSFVELSCVVHSPFCDICKNSHSGAVTRAHSCVMLKSYCPSQHCICHIRFAFCLLVTIP